MDPQPAESRTWIGEVVTQSDEYAVIGISLDGLIEAWTGAAPRLFGFTREEAIGQPFALIFTAEDTDRGLHQVELELARQSGRSEDDRWHVRKGGTRFWCNGVVNPVHGTRGQHVGYSKILRDRTDLRIRYEALQSRVRRLTQELNDKQEALGTLVHELRNTLGPIGNAVHVIGNQPDEDMRQRMLDVVVREAEVIRQVLSEAGQAMLARREPLQVRPVVLQDALKASSDALAFDARDKNISVALVLPRAAVTLEVDPPRLHQMVVNLLSNAIKYTRAGGHVTLSASIEGEMAVVRVQDDGEGIAPEYIGQVFELFAREGHDEAVPGYGIGLAVVKRLAWMHGGFVEARSPGKGAGSQFTLELPLKFGGAMPV